MTPADTSVANLMLWVAALSMLVSFGTAVWNIFSGPSRKNAERLEGHAKRLGDHDQRVAALEQAQRAAPAQADFHRLELSMSEMRGDVREMRAILGRMETIVTRHEDHLLETAKK